MLTSVTGYEEEIRVDAGLEQEFAFAVVAAKMGSSKQFQIEQCLSVPIILLLSPTYSKVPNATLVEWSCCDATRPLRYQRCFPRPGCLSLFEPSPYNLESMVSPQNKVHLIFAFPS